MTRIKTNVPAHRVTATDVTEAAARSLRMRQTPAEVVTIVNRYATLACDYAYAAGRADLIADQLLASQRSNPTNPTILAG